MALVHSSPWTHDCRHLRRIEEAGQAVQDCQPLLLVLLVLNVIDQVTKGYSHASTQVRVAVGHVDSDVLCVVARMHH